MINTIAHDIEMAVPTDFRFVDLFLLSLFLGPPASGTNVHLSPDSSKVTQVPTTNEDRIYVSFYFN